MKEILTINIRFKRKSSLREMQLPFQCPGCSFDFSLSNNIEWPTLDRSKTDLERVPASTGVWNRDMNYDKKKNLEWRINRKNDVLLQ